MITRVRIADFLTPARRTILSNAWYLVATTLVTSALGFGFWWVAARRFAAHEVGLAAAAISAMTLLGYVGMLGFGTLLIAEIHRREDRALAYVSTGILVSFGAGAVLGIAGLVAAPAVSADLASFGRTPWAGSLFVLGVALTAAGFVADQALVGLLRSRIQFLRNAIFAASKLVLLLGAAVLAMTASSGTIFATWVGGLLLSVLAIVLIALRGEPRLVRYRPDSGIVRQLGRGMLVHHALNLAVQAPNLALPVVVAAVLSPTAAGYFYAAWMMAGFVAVATPALGITLFAVGARSPDQLAHSMRMTLGISFALGVAGSLGAIVVGRFVLSTFGAAYATEAAWPLVVLMAATVPGVIKNHFIQLARLRGWIGTGALIIAIAALAELAGAILGAAGGGLAGLSGGYALVVTIEAVAMGPYVLRAADLWPHPQVAVGGPAASSSDTAGVRDSSGTP